MNKKCLKDKLLEEHAGFQGITHWLLSIFFFFMMWLIPWSFSYNYISAISSNTIFGILIFFVIGGSALLPDLDSSPLQGGGSTAIYQLGALGHVLSLLCITVSGVIYSIVHTKYDEKPKSQHRMLFHAPSIPITLYFYVNFIMPNNHIQLIHNIDLKNIGIIMIIIFAGISIYLGSNMLLYKLLNLVNKQRYTQFICLFIMVSSIFYMFFMSYSSLKLIGTAISLGYLFHIIEDLATEGSSPIFFPLPIPNMKGKIRFWWKPRIMGPFAITTGGVVNIILNFALMGSNTFLAWFLFVKK